MHSYFDVSNLNAEYDATVLAGLGAASPDEEDYPWMQYSDETQALQVAANAALNANGYCPISQDGKLGPATCGAVRKMISLQESEQYPPTTCESFTEPSKKPCGGGGGGAPPVLPGDLVTPPTIGAGMSGDTMWLVGGGVVAAVAIGAALYMRKKGALRANPCGGRRRPRKNRRRR